MVRAAPLLVLATLLACKGDERAPGPPPPPPETLVTADAGAAPIAADGGITTLKPHNPGGAYAFDEMPSVRPTSRSARDRKPVQILLRSTPPGAIAAVDGVRVGATPVLWEGDATGDTREFTFVLAGHALARYRFVPVTSGIVHGTLQKVTDDTRAQAPAIPPAAPPPPRGPGAASAPSPAPPPPPAPRVEEVVAPPVDAAPPIETAITPPSEQPQPPPP